MKESLQVSWKRWEVGSDTPLKMNDFDESTQSYLAGLRVSLRNAPADKTVVKNIFWELTDVWYEESQGRTGS